MLHMLKFLFFGGIAAAAFLCATGAQKEIPEPRVVELSGRLRRPVKWTPQLEVMPDGQVPRIDLQGELLREIKDGTALRLRGVARTRLHRGGTDANPSPFPPQWIVWIEVTEIEVLNDPSDVLK